MDRILALDIGEKTIGLAISDPLHITSQGLYTITRTDLENDIKSLNEVIELYDVKLLVVGLPINMDGSESESSRKIKEFVKEIKKHLNLEIIFEDERLTTVYAEKTLISLDKRREERKKIIDTVAASIILQSYLDRKG